MINWAARDKISDKIGVETKYLVIDSFVNTRGLFFKRNAGYRVAETFDTCR